MKKFKMISLAVLLITNFGYLSAQENEVSNSSYINPYSNIFTDIPKGYFLSYTGSYPLFEDTKTPLVGNLRLSLSGILQLTITNEGSVANMLADIRTMSTWGIQVQIVPQRDNYPSLSLWVNSSLGSKGETLNQNDFGPKLPNLVDQVFSINYQYSSTAAGVATEMQPFDGLEVAFNIGILELRSNNLLLFLEPDPFNGNWIQDSNESSSLMFDGGTVVSFSPVDKFYVIGELSTLPYFNVDISGAKLAIQHSLSKSIGIRYALPIPMNIDAYLSSNSINGQSVNQFRLGLSGLLDLNTDW